MGGAEVFTREVATRWVKAGHQVTLFTAGYPDEKPSNIQRKKTEEIYKVV